MTTLQSHHSFCRATALLYHATPSIIRAQRTSSEVSENQSFSNKHSFEKRSSKKLLPFLSAILASWLEPNTVAFQTFKLPSNRGSPKQEAGTRWFSYPFSMTV